MKKSLLAIFILIISFLFISQDIVSAQDLYLYGGQNHDVYLGCLTCNKYDSESIWNKYGAYGSKYNDKSIWNKYGTFGSKYNTYCPWNEYSNNPPVVVDKEGDFYGYFSANKYISKRVTNEWLLEICDNWEWIMDNFDKYVDKLKLN